MANLPEVVQYDAGIYQIETTDPVLGGVNGTTNIPLKNLANRTAYLKKHVDDLESGVTLPPGTATETYVQNELAKLPTKKPVRVATTANITLSGTQTIDGVAVQVGDRVLVKDQTNAAQNGIYVVAASAWTRATDADSAAEVYPNITVEVSEGTLQADTTWRLTNNGSITLGTTLLAFARIGVDLTGYAPLANPAFSGTPTAPTPDVSSNDTRIATTAFVQGAMGRLTGYAPLASPVFTGNPTAPTAAAGTNTKQIATTEFVRAAVSADAAPASHVGAVGNAHGVATTSAAGFMSAGDKAKLDGIGSGANVSSVDGAAGAVNLANLFSFAKSLSQNGYQKLPSGLIIQWGKAVSVAIGGTAGVTFPLAFPNLCAAAFADSIVVNTGSSNTKAHSWNTTGMSVFNGDNGISNVHWLAIGY